MTRDARRRLPLARKVALAGIVASGLVAIVGSGGGFPDFKLDFDGLRPIPTAQIEPARVTVQAGSAVRFTARVTHVSSPTYRWCRISLGSDVCTDLPGVTGDSYTLPSANLADDGAILRVSVSDPNGAAAATAALWVSSMPGVVFQDGEFQPSDWTVSAVAEPAQGGPSYTMTRSATDGNPGAFQSTTITVPAGPATLRIYQVARAALYDPAAHGAIHVLDFGEDCWTPGVSTTNAYIGMAPMLEQSGRRYLATANWQRGCSAAIDSWLVQPARSGLVAQDFERVDGPACDTGESCPDFSAQGAPLRLGFAHVVGASAAVSTGSRTRGIDNWTATVWRR